MCFKTDSSLLCSASLACTAEHFSLNNIFKKPKQIPRDILCTHTLDLNIKFKSHNESAASRKNIKSDGFLVDVLLCLDIVKVICQ